MLSVWLCNNPIVIFIVVHLCSVFFSNRVCYNLQFQYTDFFVKFKFRVSAWNTRKCKKSYVFLCLLRIKREIQPSLCRF